MIIIKTQCNFYEMVLKNSLSLKTRLNSCLERYEVSRNNFKCP